MKLSVATILALAATVNAGDVPSLTPDNYEALTDGKTVFIKFFAPWCGHCKKMAADWEKLSADWESNETGFIAEVDCTTEGKPLCDANGVGGFPTLKYGDPSDLQDYQGGRTYDALSKFAAGNLKPVCSPTKLELCDDDKKKEIEGYMSKSADELATLIKAEEEKLEDAEKTFKEEVQKLQDTYQKLSQDKDDTIAAVKASGLGLMKSVSKVMAKKDAAKEEL